VSDILGLDADAELRSAADEVQRLVDELESTLDARERRLLHQLRLAAETLGAVRAREIFPTRHQPRGARRLHGETGATEWQE
jgi:hypothetical protein